mgnify:CR=1 FL=1
MVEVHLTLDQELLTRLMDENAKSDIYSTPNGPSAGGLGGGGETPPAGSLTPGNAGDANTGGGGSGGTIQGTNSAVPGAGGSGIVIIRYKFQ